MGKARCQKLLPKIPIIGVFLVVAGEPLATFTNVSIAEWLAGLAFYEKFKLKTDDNSNTDQFTNSRCEYLVRS